MLNGCLKITFCLLLSCCGSKADDRSAIAEIFQRLQHLENKVADQAETIRLQSLEIAAFKQTNTPESLNCEKERHREHGKEKSRRFVLDNDGLVAFTAAITPRVIPHVKHMEIIKFETVITSVGGGYNNQSGVFVVPVSGIYAFSCSLLDEAGDNGTYYGTKLHAEIIHDQRVLGRIFAHAETRAGVSYRDQGAQTVFTLANQGEQVWVRAIDNADLGLGGELYSTFSGCLLHAV